MAGVLASRSSVPVEINKKTADLPTGGRPSDFGVDLPTDLVPGYPAFPGGASSFDSFENARLGGLTNVKLWELPEGTQLPDCLAVICDGGINGNPVGHYSIVPTDPTMTAEEVTNAVQSLGWQQPANGVVVSKNHELKWL